MENYHLESFNDIPNVLDRRRDKERELVANGLNVRDSEPGSNCFMPNPVCNRSPSFPSLLLSTWTSHGFILF
jgi:hypothetical protein